MIAAVESKLTELKILIVKCFNTILLKMQNGYPFEYKSAKAREIKEAIYAVDYIENQCCEDGIDVNEAINLIEYHILNLRL